MKTALTLDERQCKIIIKSLEYYCDVLYAVSHPQLQEEMPLIEAIYNQIPDEYFKGLAK